MIPALRDNVTVVRHPWSLLSPSVVGVSLRRPQSFSSHQVAKVSMDVLSMKMRRYQLLPLLQPLAWPSLSENAILNEVTLDSPSCAGYEDIWNSRANFSGWEV